MNTAFDFLFNLGNDWLPVGFVDVYPLGKQRLTESGTGSTLLLLSLAVLVPYLLPRFSVTGFSRLRYTAMCLLWLSFWPMSCTPVEPVERDVSARKAPDPDCATPGCVPTPTVRAPKGMPPPAAPQGLPIPTFSPQTGTVAFGTKIKLSVTSLPPGAIIEYSHDNGKTWIPGDQAPVLGTEPILSRTRINSLTSNPAQAAFKPFYQRMMVLGNSIMNHAPLPAQGWFNNNGMAASAPANDFVHLLTARLAQEYPQVAVRLVSAGEFERNFSRPEYSLDEFNEPLRQFKPDLIIVRLGENVSEGNVFSPIGFEAQFRRLLERLATYSGQPARIVCTTSVWRRPRTDAIIRQVAGEKGIPLADFVSLVGQDQYFAIGQYADAGVAAHPNDAGMKQIADLIWQKLP